MIMVHRRNYIIGISLICDFAAKGVSKTLKERGIPSNWLIYHLMNSTSTSFSLNNESFGPEDSFVQRENVVLIYRVIVILTSLLTIASIKAASEMYVMVL